MLMLLRWLLHHVLHLCRLLLRWLSPQPQPRRPSPRTSGPVRQPHAPPKPDWVRREIIRLKALLPDAGCRTIAHVFNRRFAARKGMTVGKSYVAETVKRHQYAILSARRKLKHAIPRPIPRHLIWGLDLTMKRDARGRSRLILAIVDHASRACLRLQALADKSALTLLRSIEDTSRQYGSPKYLRTDNEPVLVSVLFRMGLWLMGIRHQRTDLHCPWQNGRVERFFGTLKRSLNHWHVDTGEELDEGLRRFRLFYNHVRPHHHLQGRTPAESWAGTNVFAQSSRMTEWMNMWEGVLQEYYADSG
jgi:putative transposase